MKHVIRRLLPALALILALATPAAGHAATRAETVSAGAWPDSSCAVNAVIHYNAGPALDAEYPDGVWIDGATGQPAGGMADPATCQIWLRGPQTDDEDMCNVLTHERGHLAGLDHQSPLNDGIMHLGYWGHPRYVECWKAFELESPMRTARRAVGFARPCQMVARYKINLAYRCGHRRVIVRYYLVDGELWSDGQNHVAGPA